MPTFELSGPDGAKYQVTAPDENSALLAFQKFSSEKNVSRETPDAVTPRSMLENVNLTIGSAAEGVPIIGGMRDTVNAAANALLAPVVEPFLEKGPDSIADTPGATWMERLGNRYEKSKELLKADREKFAEDNPIVDTAAKIAGGVLGTAPLIAVAPAAFGIGGASLPASMAAGGASGAALSAADAAVRGDDPVRAAMFGAGAGAAGPLIGKAVGSVAARARRGTTAKNDLALAAQRQGVEFPAVAATDSLVTQRAGAALKEIPVVGDPIVKASRRANEQMGDALSKVEHGFGTGSVLNAGDAAKTGLVDWITGKSADVTKRLYSNVDTLVNPNVTSDLGATRSMIADIAAARQQAALAGPGKASELVLDAVQRPGGLNYEGIKTLRTSIGEMLDSGLLPSDISKTELKRVYGALTSDLRTAVQNAGGHTALKAFNKANTLNSIVASRREALAKIVGADADAAPEKVLDRLVAMASGNARADLTKLMQVRKTIGSENWDEVASAAVSKIGRDAEGNFSPDRFLTAYGKISPNGKKLLFNSTGKSDLAQALEDISLLSSKAKNLSSFGNPSGTGRVVGGISLVGAGATSPHLAIPGAFGAWLIAQVMSHTIKPSTIRLATTNPNIARMLQHIATIGALGPTSGGSVGRIPLQTATPLPAPIQ